MRICFLANAKSVHTKRWASFFAERGHEIHVISRVAAELDCASVYAPKLPGWIAKRSGIVPQLIAQVLNAVRIRPLVRRIAPDVLVAFTLQSYGVLAMLSGFHPVMSFHLGATGISVWPEVSLIGRMIVRRILKTADVLHTFDQASRERIIEMGCEPRKVYVNPWGINTNDFVRQKRSEVLRGEMGPGDGPVVACVRTLEPQYDIETYIKAMPLVEKKIPDVRFILIGSGSQSGYLCELARSLKVRNFKHLGYVQYDKFPDYIASCDVYVDTVNMPLRKGSTWYGRKINCSMTGLGYTQTLPAAMSCELGWTVTSRPGIDEIMPAGFERFLFPFGDEEKLANNIIELLADEQMRRRMGRLSREIIQRMVNWNDNAVKMEERLQYLVDKMR